MFGVFVCVYVCRRGLAREQDVVVPEHQWRERGNDLEWRRRVPEPMPMGKWLVQNMPRGYALELPDRADPPRRVPFSDREEE